MLSLPFAVIGLAFRLLSSAHGGHWVATWAAAPSPPVPAGMGGHVHFERVTLREIVHASVGGHSVRVRFSNVFGTEPFTLASASVAIAGAGPGVAPGSLRPLTFGGETSFRIPPGAIVLSDPVELSFPPGADLAVSMYIGRAEGGGLHYGAVQTSYVAPGDQSESPALESAKPISYWAFLAGVDIEAPNKAATLIAYGDSITDGAHSTPSLNHRWPDFLAARLLAQPEPASLAVIDEGIGGNCLLHDSPRVQSGVSALRRFDRDVLAQPGVRSVIVLEGINDIGHPGTSAPASEAVSASDLIGAYRQLIARSHENGLRIYGGTLLPFEGAARGYYTPQKEKVRSGANAWIRSAREFDGVIDFDRAVRDPDHPLRMLPAYDSGDHLHPNDAGYAAMAAAIDLGMIER